MEARKLKYYCQPCRKQLKDRDAYACHMVSQGHLNQIEVFAANPRKALQNYSQEFEESFISFLKVKYKGKEEYISSIYRHYAANPRHVKLESTQWRNMPSFVQVIQNHYHQIKLVQKEADYLASYCTSEKMKPLPQLKLDPVIPPKNIKNMTVEQLQCDLSSKANQCFNFQVKIPVGEKRSSQFLREEDMSLEFQVISQIKDKPRKHSKLDKLLERLQKK